MEARWFVSMLLALTLAPAACSSGDGGGGDLSPADVTEAGTDDGLPDDAGEDVAGEDTAGTPDGTMPADAVLEAADDLGPGDAGTGDATDASAPPDAATDPGGTVDPKCLALVAGTVKDFDVDGTKRTFLLTLPNLDTPRQWPVVFNWHGFGDTAVNMSSLLALHVNDAAFSFILVTPEDLNLQPPAGMDWDILSVQEPHAEARLFDEVLECLDQVYGVDRDRVHSVGFSAGAIMTDLLGVLRGDAMASLVTFSGTYFSDAGNVTALGMLSSYVSWPDLSTANPYAQLLVHGSAADNYNLSVVKLQFDANGQRDVPYLTGLGHDVIHCAHGQGHTVPGAMMDEPIVRFLADHPRGVGSPWVAAGLPGIYPDYCQVVPAP